MKTLILSLFLLTVGSAFAQNSLYLQQISTAAVVNVLQSGATNRIGSSGVPSTITGDNVNFDIKQVGSSNAIDFAFNGNGTTLKLYNTGDTNTQGLYINGANNSLDLEFVGNNNTLLFNNDGTNSSTTQASVANGTYSINVNGNSNAFNIGSGTGSYNNLDYKVAGNSNAFNILQNGIVSGTSGHSQQVEVAGNSNNVYINQSGTNANLLYYKLTGSNTSTVITQGPTGTTPLNIATSTGVTHP